MSLQRNATLPFPSLPRLWQLVLAATILVVAAALPVAGADTAYLHLDADGLEDLGAGWVYEGWIIVDGAPVSTGTFTVSAHGEPSQSRFAVAVTDTSQIAAFVLSIEPWPDADPTPSAVKLLGGDFSSGVASLSVAHGAALGDDLTAATGSYILNAPSGGESGMYVNGIWWLDPAAGPGPTLDIPTLPAGWVYEGWVVGGSGPMSTGRFTSASGVDSDGAGLTGGPFAAPPFPGQDLLNPPADLTAGYAAVLSIEPEPDNGPGPFTLKPLVDMNIDDVGAGVLQEMSNQASSFPTATVTLLDEAAQSEIARLMLNLHGLDDLGSGWAYEGWLIVDGAAVSSGRFTVAGGVMSQTYFPTEVSSLEAVSTFVLTVEPDPDADPGPSTVHLVAGDFVGARAALAIDHMAALGTDFTGAAGSYILNAPSGEGAAEYVNGIWWLDPAAGPGPVLELPELPAGWMYEGWVASSEGPVSTGRFTSADGMDSDGAGPDGGAGAFPPFPGQDFINPARDLTSGYAAVISVEPEPDNSTAPFTLKPLLDPNIDDVGAGVLQPMGNNAAATNPMGAAVLMHPWMIPASAHAEGVNQTVWRTDVVVHNGGSQASSVVIELLEANQGNAEPESALLSLPSGTSMRYGDVVDSLFEHEGNAALRVLADGDMVTVTSRTFTDTGPGSYGQSIPPYAAGEAIGFGDHALLIQLEYSTATDSGFRSNVGFVNPGTGSVDIQVDLYAGDGTWLGSPTYTLEAGEQTQVTNIFASVTDSDVEAGYAVVWTSTPGGWFFTYASVVDNQTGDAVYVRAR